MTRDITPAGSPATGAVDEAFAEPGRADRTPCGRDRGAGHDDGGGCHGGLRAAPRSRRGGRTVGAERGDGSASTAARLRSKAPAGPGAWTAARSRSPSRCRRRGGWPSLAMSSMPISGRRAGSRPRVRLPGGVRIGPIGVSKSWRPRGVLRGAGSARAAETSMAADLSALDLLVVQIDGLHLGDDPRAGRRDRGRRRRQQASAGSGGRGDRERRHGAGPAGQPGLARTRPDGAKTVHRRRRESVVEGGSAAPRCLAASG